MKQKIYTVTVTSRPPDCAVATAQSPARRNPGDVAYCLAVLSITLIVAGFLAAACLLYEQAEPEAVSPAETEAEAVQTAEELPATLAAQVDLYDPEVPVSREIQTYMRTYCARYGVPYSLVLATAQVESNFNMDAVGAVGEVGMMQLNPGPDGAYHAELQAATGLDPATPEGNVAGACWILAQYMAQFGEANQVAMCYNMGYTGALNARRSGVESTEYSRAVVAAMAAWDAVLEGRT